MLYTEHDREVIRSMLRRRWLMTAIPSALILIAAIVIFVMGRMERSDTLWMLTAALTVVGGGYFLFFYGVLVHPARIYRTHLGYMLEGRMRVTTGVYKSFSPETTDHDGLEAHAMLLNIGDKDDPEDDRLFYYDALKPAPAYPLGTRVTVKSNDKMVSSITEA